MRSDRSEGARRPSRSMQATTRELALHRAKVTDCPPSSRYQRRASCSSSGWQKRNSGSLTSTAWCGKVSTSSRCTRRSSASNTGRLSRGQASGSASGAAARARRRAHHAPAATTSRRAPARTSQARGGKEAATIGPILPPGHRPGACAGPRARGACAKLAPRVGRALAWPTLWRYTDGLSPSSAGEDGRTRFTECGSPGREAPGRRFVRGPAHKGIRPGRRVAHRPHSRVREPRRVRASSGRLSRAVRRAPTRNPS